MELSGPRPFVITAPGCRVMPVLWCSSRPIEVPSEYVVVVSFVVVAVKTLHYQRRMNTVKVADGEMSVHGRIAIAHIIGAAGACIAVAAVAYLTVFQFIAGYFSTCGAINHRDIEGPVTYRL